MLSILWCILARGIYRFSHLSLRESSPGETFFDESIRSSQDKQRVQAEQNCLNIVPAKSQLLEECLDSYVKDVMRHSKQSRGIYIMRRRVVAH